MTRHLTVAFGVLMIASGSYFIWQGMEIVQIERGWTQVISGACVLAGGFVTAAIGLLIGSVEALRSALLETRNRPAESKTARSGQSLPPAPSEPPTPPVTSAPPRIPVQANPFQAVPVQAVPVQERSPPAAVAARNEREAVATVTGAAPIPIRRRPPAPAASAPAPQRRPALNPDPHDWIESALADITADQNALSWNRAQPAANDAATIASHEAKPEARKVLRRYESGGANYTLYADGSIDSEAPGGRLHFASMKEFRDYLARQETSSGFT